MIIRIARFNTYLLCAALLAVQFGCATDDAKKEEKKKDKQVTALSLHLEAYRDDLGRTQAVPISRASDIKIYVDKDSFLDEAQIVEARVMDDHGSFTIFIQFDKRGTWLLENYTSSNPGKRVAIRAQWGEKLDKMRWLGAPQITRRTSDGRMFFTPDASREEADEIVRGLNNVAIKSGNQEKPKKAK